MNNSSILLISNGNFEKDFLEKIALHVSSEFLCPVKVEESYFDLGEYYDTERRQYNGNKLLDQINLISATPLNKKIGLFRVDLFIPILTFIFGQAVLNGNAGIASLYRLRNEHYGMKKDESLLANRFEKIIIHELGHTFGLIHCHTPTCVMRSSTYVEDIDQKSCKICSKCRLSIGL